MDKFFITATGVCAVILSVLCAYRYFTHEYASYVELVCSAMFLAVSVIAFYTRKWCE